MTLTECSERNARSLSEAIAPSPAHLWWGAVGTIGECCARGRAVKAFRLVLRSAASRNPLGGNKANCYSSEDTPQTAAIRIRVRGVES